MSIPAKVNVDIYPRTVKRKRKKKNSLLRARVLLHLKANMSDINLGKNNNK